MQTRPTALAPRYIRPLPSCPFCKRKFAHYHEVYMHARALHDQIIDSTFTCELCNQVCKNPRGLHVHTTHSHRVWKREMSGEEEKEGIKKRRRLRDTAEDSVWLTPVPSPIKSEFCAASPVSPAPPPAVPTPVTVTCPVCGQEDSKEQMERHISVHDEAITRAYRGLPEVAKVLVAGRVLDLTAVKKHEE